MAFLAFFSCVWVQAHDFTVTQNGQRLCFNFKSKKDRTIEVTYFGSIAESNVPKLAGTIEIPGKVKHNNEVYTVVCIGEKAFSGAVNLEGVIIPASVKTIENFAFEDCRNLSTVVFPGENIKWGQGVFFKCKSIKNVSFGSDWTSVDFAMFRWSDSLRTISIPAKVKQIKNLKMLKALQSIVVDAGNTHFKSVGGVLYNKDATVLYGCPRAYSGNLKVCEGTKVIEKGAFADCIGITLIDFPETLQSLSFRETRRLKHLQTVLFRGKTPLCTAYKKMEGRLVLQTPQPELQIVVPSASKNAYKSMLIEEAAEFTEEMKENSTPYVVSEDELPKVKNVVGTKDFSKYLEK